MLSSIVDPGNNNRPPVETSLHEIIQYKFIVHLYPNLINGLFCSRNAKSLTQKLKFLTPQQVSFIDQLETENYRRKIARSAEHENRIKNKIAVITGGAHGFGAGIAESLFAQKLNVVMADTYEEAGISIISRLV